MLQICESLCRENKVLYVSGEESEHQLKLRAKRLDVQSERLFVISETSLGGPVGVRGGGGAGRADRGLHPDPVQ